MKKNLTKGVVSLSGVLVLALAGSWALGQSPQMTNRLEIKTDRFTAVQNIKQVHLNEKLTDQSINKVGLMNT